MCECSMAEAYISTMWHRVSLVCVQDVIVYVAREGVATSDLFRRPGSHTDLKLIVRRLAEGSPVQLSDYNFYTLASVIKVIAFLH